MKTKFYLSQLFVLSSFLLGCGSGGGDSVNPAVAKYVSAIEGTYDLKGATCNRGSFQGALNQILSISKATVTINGSKMTANFKFSESCTVSSVENITEMTDQTITTVSGAVSCSPTCKPSECPSQTSSGNKTVGWYSAAEAPLLKLTAFDKENDCSTSDAMVTTVLEKLP